MNTQKPPGNTPKHGEEKQSNLRNKGLYSEKNKRTDKNQPGIDDVDAKSGERNNAWNNRNR